MHNGTHRILQLLDERSFIAMGQLVENSGVVAGYGTINGRFVYTYSQEGQICLAGAHKIKRAYEGALKTGVPVVGILDSAGINFEDERGLLEALGFIYTIQSEASGVIPQFSVILGPGTGCSSFIAGFSDFVITHGSTGAEDIAHFIENNEQDCVTLARNLLSYVPANHMDDPLALLCNDDLNRKSECLNTILDDESTPLMDTVINELVDKGSFLAQKSNNAANIKAGFGRMGGHSVGFIANDGNFTIASVDKILRFVQFCDAFHIPIVTLTDANTYDALEADLGSWVRPGAELIHAFVNATVPKVNVVIRNTAPNLYFMMNSKFIGADMVFAWPGANVSATDADDVIEPALTRKHILSALEMLSSKRIVRRFKKHSGLSFFDGSN